MKPLLGLLLWALMVLGSSDNSFVVLAPKTVSPGRLLKLVVTILNASEPVTVSGSLESQYWVDYPYYHYRQNRLTHASANATFRARGQALLALSVPANLSQDAYQLDVTVRRGIRVDSQKVDLSFYSKSFSTFIQTDKAIYKPGQTVNLRVLAVDSELRAYPGPLDVELVDPNNNKIKQWLATRSPLGVFSGLHRLSAMPVLGHWKIKVTVLNQSPVEATFEVANYQLPLYEVKVELPPFVLTTDKEVKGKVKATYTYGEPVKGIVEVQASLGSQAATDQYSCSGSQQKIIMSYPLDGEGKFTIPMEELQRISNYLNGQTLQVTAFVTESLTGKKLEGSSSVQFYSKDVKVDFPTTNPSSFKPGLRYSGHVRVLQVDGRPLPGAAPNTTLYPCVTYRTRQENQDRYRTCSDAFTGTYGLKEQSVVVSSLGLASFSLDVPADAIEVSLSAHFRDVSATTSIKRAYSPSDSFLQLELPKDNATAGEVLDIVVRTTRPGNDYFFHLASRGIFVSSGRIPASRGENTTFSLKVTPDMAPHARLVVFYVNAEGEVVADSAELDVSGVFANNVSLAFSQNASEPGDKVDVKVTASPHSLVCLLAVDQSVTLMAEGNTVTREKVEQELRYYDSRGTVHGYVGDTDAFQVFQKAGVHVYTDAQVPSNPGGSVLGNTVDRTHPTFAPTSTIAYYTTTFNPNGPFPGMTPMPSMIPAPMFQPTMVAPGSNANPQNPTSLQEVTRTRAFFPETWLWNNVTTGSDGRAVVSAVVPDTITSWVASAFAVSPDTGLGVSEDPAKLQVFRPFFVSLSLPLSVVRGEQVVVQADVFNYIKQDLDVVVSLPQSSEYDHLVFDPVRSKLTVVNTDQAHQVHVPSGESRAVSFAIAPKVLGKVDLTVSARSKLAADAESRQLEVVAEGVQKETNSVVLLDLLSSDAASASLNATLPPHVVADSIRARIRAFGDALSPSLTGLDSLLQLPTGCGEQNMLHFAPDIYVAQYLQASNQFTGQVEQKILPLLEDGYQRELTYQRQDGSFSAFGDSDYYGSTWLTAFVVKSFYEAKQFIYVDNGTIARGVSWLISRQNYDGSFREEGHIINHLMQGGSSNGYALTAYVLSALAETVGLVGVYEEALNSSISKARANLEFNIVNFPDPYTTAIATYALTRVGSHFAKDAFERMEHEATVKDGLKFWQTANAEIFSDIWWQPSNHRSTSQEVEATAYALLVYAERRDFASGLPALKWLAKQRNPNGGFISTQDTVVALQAMSRFARTIASASYHVTVDVKAGNSDLHFDISQVNALDIQGQDVSGTLANPVSAKAKGHGIAYVELATFFNVDSQVEEPSFDVTQDVELEALNTFTLRTCIKYLRSGATGMAVVEIGMPSGFRADRDTIKGVANLKRMEERGQSLVLYLTSLDHTPTCLRLTARRTDMVVATKPSPIQVYDYYEPARQALAFYRSDLLSHTTVCDVCATCCPRLRAA